MTTLTKWMEWEQCVKPISYERLIGVMMRQYKSHILYKVIRRLWGLRN